MKRYLFALTIPAAVGISLEGGGPWAWFALFYAFGFLPLLELLLPAASANLDPAQEADISRQSRFDWLLRIMLPVQLLLLHRFFSAFREPLTGDGWETAGRITAMGVACGVIGINVAHELGHRRSRLDRWLARVLLSTSLYWQFYVEHNRGHHKNVATAGDPESAPRGETVYHFWVRSLRDSFFSAWRLDPREMTAGTAAEAALLFAICFFYGPTALIAFLPAAIFGMLLLQSVNYIEHYGLERIRLASGGFEPVEPRHSWNSDHPLSRAVLFELSRHSDHHAHATRKYQVLRHLEPSPQLPTGYPGMILLALVPRLWFRIMDPRLSPPQSTKPLTDS
jgi:alkane 1-monooxygenase